MDKSVYRRPEKPKTVESKIRIIKEIKNPSAAIIELPVVHASSECHVTPSDVAERMASYLGHRQHVLEPSAGTGNLLVAVSANRKTAIERNTGLCGIIEKRTGINPVCDDFLEYQPTEMFDGIIMNPPFSKARKHIEKAISCLEPGGSLVSIVPSTFDEKKYGAEVLENLPPDTFASCKVYSKIIYIEKRITLT